MIFSYYILIITIISCIISYICGSFTFGYFAVKFLYDIDIRTLGSKNIGATNVWRNGYKILAILTFLFDAFKALIAALIGIGIVKIFDNFLSIDETEILKRYIPILCGGFCILGHLFSIFLKFKGGKGVSSFFGFLFLVSKNFFLFGALVWIIVFLIKRISSISSLSVMLFAIFYSILFIDDNFIKIIVFLTSCLIIIAHRQNIRNLLTRNIEKESLKIDKQK
jgi:glycerol-3-phosphate acyltransferase PlsY